MLRKLLKYDLKSVGRIWWIVAVSVLGLATFGSLLLRVTVELIANDGPVLLYIFGSLISYICIIVLFSSSFVTLFLTHFRFYKNFFTDEGYLTFTLPVSRRQLLLSKTINTLIWTSAHGVLLFVCFLIYMTIVPPGEGWLIINPMLLWDMGEGIVELWKHIGAWLIVYGLELLLILFTSSLFSIGLVQFCITIGAVIAKRVKLLAGIGVYYAVNMILSFAFSFALIFGVSTMGEGLVGLLNDLTIIGRQAAVALILLIVAVITSALAAILHFSTLGSLERKLNLP